LKYARYVRFLAEKVPTQRWLTIYHYQNISAVEQNVKDLQDRVCHLMVVIIDNVTSKIEEGGEEVIVKAAKGIEQDIKDLLRYAQSS
jgi:hypothetical protein